MIRNMTRGSVFALLALLALPLHAGAQGLRIVGGLSNFDCYNGTGGECEGFEIEIDNEHKEDVIHTWAYSAFGAPTVLDGGTAAAPTAIIRYHSTTVKLAPNAVTHFGISLTNFPAASSIHYRWLPAGTRAIPNPPPVLVSLPTHQSQVVVSNGVPTVHDVITNTSSETSGHTFWVLPIAHLVYRPVALEELMSDDPVVADGTPEGGGSNGDKPERLDPGESWSNEDEGTEDGDASVVYSYEIYTDVVTTVNGKKVHSPGALTANMMDATITASGPIVPNQLTFSNSPVYGTVAVTGTVSINGVAPAGGMTISLTSSDPHVSLPASVVIAANTNAAAFAIATTAVPILTTATITAAGNSGTISGDLQVMPPDLTVLYLSYLSNFSGSAFDAAVYLISPAPAEGMTVLLGSSDPTVASVPDAVTVLPGATEAHFTVQTYGVTTPQNITIEALLGGVYLVQPLTVNPSHLISGVVTLQQVTNPAQDVSLEFRPAGGGSPLNRPRTLSSTGAYTVNDIPPGKYNLAVNGSKWLRSVIAIDSTAKAVTDANASLPGGDANNDNTVNFDDFLVLLNAFGSTYDPNNPSNGFDSQADFTCDGKVNFDDFLVLLDNFGVIGDL